MSDIKDQIVKLWKDGKQGGEIAAKLKMTRNAVMGHLYRLRKKGLIEYKDPVSAAKVSEARTKKLMARIKKPYRSPYEQIPLPFPVIPKGIGVSFMELNSNSCRYVLNDGNPADFRFCGQPKASKAYCEDHHKICYYTPTKSKKTAFVKRKLLMSKIKVFTRSPAN